MLMTSSKTPIVVKCNVLATYSVSVNMYLSLKEMIKAGEYDYVNRNITAANFPIGDVYYGSKDAIQRLQIYEDITIDLVNFDFQDGGTIYNFQRKTYRQILQAISEAGYRPTTTAEVLALGAQHQNVQLGRFIISLGQFYKPGWLSKKEVIMLGYHYNGVSRALKLKHMNESEECFAGGCEFDCYDPPYCFSVVQK